ncbi:Histone-lysine N-methyltransferase ATXR6 [Diplonema papillatum]|nr:Histone-lysine N-methyltransferase ATXR6 [Diplonema papillatum]
MRRCHAPTCKRARKDRRRLLGPWYCWQHAKMLGAAAAGGGTAIESSTQGAAAAEAAQTRCHACGAGIDKAKMVLCETFDCGRWYHVYCVTPKLPHVPIGAWYCPEHVDSQAHCTKLVPDAGEKVMVMMSGEMTWWPACIVPTTAAYLPRTVARKAGGAAFDGRPHKKYKRRTKTARLAGCSRTLVAAYFGEPFGTGSELTSLRFDWDKIRPLDFNSDAWYNPSPALATALAVARHFDLDLASNDKIRYVPCPSNPMPVGGVPGVDLHTAFVLHLAAERTDLAEFCKRRAVSRTALRQWLCRKALEADGDAAEARAALAAVREATGRENRELSAQKRRLEEDTPKVHSTAKYRKAATSSQVDAGTNGQPTCVPPPGEAAEAAPEPPAREVPPRRQSLVELWHRYGAQCASESGLTATFGVTPAVYNHWRRGELERHVAAHIDRSIAHILSWHIGHDVVRNALLSNDTRGAVLPLPNTSAGDAPPPAQVLSP